MMLTGALIHLLCLFWPDCASALNRCLSLGPPNRVGDPGRAEIRTGRPAGARNKFSAQFVADVAQVWERHGRAVLERLVVEEPARFAN